MDIQTRAKQKPYYSPITCTPDNTKLPDDDEFDAGNDEDSTDDEAINTQKEVKRLKKAVPSTNLSITKSTKIKPPQKTPTSCHQPITNNTGQNMSTIKELTQNTSKTKLNSETQHESLVKRKKKDKICFA